MIILLLIAALLIVLASGVIDRNYGATNDRIYGAIFSSVFTPCGYLIFA